MSSTARREFFESLVQQLTSEHRRLLRQLDTLEAENSSLKDGEALATLPHDVFCFRRDSLHTNLDENVLFSKSSAENPCDEALPAQNANCVAAGNTHSESSCESAELLVDLDRNDSEQKTQEVCDGDTSEEFVITRLDWESDVGEAPPHNPSPFPTPRISDVSFDVGSRDVSCDLGSPPARSGRVSGTSSRWDAVPHSGSSSSWASTISTTPSKTWKRRFLTRRGLRLTLRLDDLEARKAAVTGEATREDHCLKSFVIRPDSVVRLLWDLASIIMICYDVIRMPLDIVFKSPDTPMTDVLEGVVTVFWTCDIPVSFATGYHAAGLIEMRPRQVAKSYMSSWFALDLLIVVADWTFFLIALQDGADAINVIRMAKSTRIFRMVRAMRILRFAKFYRILSDLLVHIKSEQLRAIFAIVVMIACIVFFNHYIACGWIWLGQSDTHGSTWLRRHSSLEHGVNSYQYATALHWSLTQFTPASMDVSATNIVERVYSILVLLFALVTFTSFVSSITTSMTYLRKMRSEPEQQEAILREYFLQNKITAELGQRIWNFLWANHFAIKKRLHEKDIPILTLLPDFLRSKVREELHQPVLTRLPFLMRYNAMNVAGVYDLCHSAVEEVSLTPGDELFSKGNSAKTMFFITAGIMEYQHPVPSLCCEVRSVEWVCEPALWLKWLYLGRLLATSSAEVCSLDVKVFCDTMTKHEMHVDFVMEYKRLFTETVPNSDVCVNPKKLERMARIAASRTSHLRKSRLSSFLGQFNYRSVDRSV